MIGVRRKAISTTCTTSVTDSISKVTLGIVAVAALIIGIASFAALGVGITKAVLMVL